MRDIIDILNGLTKTEQFKHDPFLIVTITYKHIHSIDSEDWVSALKVIFAQQPVPFSFVETPNPTKKQQNTASSTLQAWENIISSKQFKG